MSEFEAALKALGIDRGAGPAGARRAYQNVMKTRGAAMSAESLHELEDAYQYLSKPTNWPPPTRPGRPGAPPARPAKSDGSRPVTSPRSPAKPKLMGPGPRLGPATPAARRFPPTPIPRRRPPPPRRPPTPAKPAPEIALTEEQTRGVHALVAGHPGLDGEALLAAMRSSEEDAVGRALADLLGGPLDAAAAAARLVFQELAQHPDRPWVTARTGARLTLRFLNIGAHDEAHAANAKGVFVAANHWRTAADKADLKPDAETAKRWRWAQQLMTVSGRIDMVVWDALARAAQAGDLFQARHRVQAWVDTHRAEADTAKRVLREAAPDLAAAVDDILPFDVKKKSKVVGGFELPSFGSRLWLGLLGVALLVALLTLLAEGDEPLDPVLDDARLKICQFAGPGKPLCVHATVVAETLQEQDCVAGESTLVRLEAAAERSIELSTVSGRAQSREGLNAGLEALRAELAARCGPGDG